MLRNNADARRCSYFELGLPVVCRVFSLFENAPVRRQSRADTRNFSKGKNSVDFTLFAMCALSHNATCLPPPPPKKTNCKNLSWHCLQFCWDDKWKTLGYAIFWAANKVYYERCATTQQQSHSWFLNGSLCYGYSWKFYKIFWLWVFSLFKTLPGCRAYNHGVF